MRSSCGKPKAVIAPHAGHVYSGDIAGSAYRLAVRHAGTFDGVEAESIQRKPPGPGEVEIQVEAAGLNFSDVMKALGMYPGLPEGPPAMGAECSGRITAVGKGQELPVASNATAAGRQQNRRVEIVFSDASGQFAKAY